MSDFERELRAEFDRIEREVAQGIIEMTTEIAANLREQSPVDTGHMRANWIPSVGEPDGEEHPGKGDAAYNKGVAAVLRYKLGDGDCFVSTNVPYAAIVNAIHPTKAGFVEAAVEDAKITIQGRIDSR